MFMLGAAAVVVFAAVLQLGLDCRKRSMKQGLSVRFFVRYTMKNISCIFGNYVYN